VAALLALVAPVMAHVKMLKAQLSATTGWVIKVVLTQEPAGVVKLTFEGQVMVGLTLSVMVTVKLHVAVFPALSRAVYVTVVTPKLKV
jgi:hypothetical protein